MFVMYTEDDNISRTKTSPVCEYVSLHLVKTRTSVGGLSFYDKTQEQLLLHPHYFLYPLTYSSRRYHPTPLSPWRRSPRTQNSITHSSLPETEPSVLLVVKDGPPALHTTSSDPPPFKVNIPYRPSQPPDRVTRTRTSYTLLRCV